MVGERLLAWGKHHKCTQRRLAEIVGMSDITFSVWRTRSEMWPDTASLLLVGRNLLLDIEWLVGEQDDTPWSYAALKARHELLQIQNEPWFSAGTPTDRLVRVYEQLSKRLPSLKEETWALYLHWQLEDWLACKHGELRPGGAQMDAAEEFTGLSERWFRDGVTK